MDFVFGSCKLGGGHHRRRLRDRSYWCSDILGAAASRGRRLGAAPARSLSHRVVAAHCLHWHRHHSADCLELHERYDWLEQLWRRPACRLKQARTRADRLDRLVLAERVRKVPQHLRGACLFRPRSTARCRLGSLADIGASDSMFALPSKADMCCATTRCPLCANSGHCALHSIPSLGLFDYIVGANVQRRRNVNAKGLRGPKIYDQFELSWPHDRKL